MPSWLQNAAVVFVFRKYSMALAPTNKPWSTPEYILPHIAAFGNLKASDVVMDCGCGDARVLVELARSHKCKCIGWEISPPRLKEAYLNIKANNCGSLVEIREDNGLNCWLLNDSISFIWAALTARGLERVFKVLLQDQGYVPLTEENKNTPGGKRLTLVTFLYKLKSKSIKPVKIKWFKNPDNVNSKYPMYLYEFIRVDYGKKVLGRYLCVSTVLGLLSAITYGHVW